ncbi:penicillin-binding transpeptidase domain-containing protein [Nocardiopsis coralliicola]
MDDRWTSPDGGPSPSESGRETDAEPAADDRKGPYTIPRAAPDSRPSEGRLFDSSGLPNPGAPVSGAGAAQGTGGGTAEDGGEGDGPAPAAAPGSGAPQDSAESGFSGSGDTDETAAFAEVSGAASGTGRSEPDGPGAGFGGSGSDGADSAGPAYPGTGADSGSAGGGLWSGGASGADPYSGGSSSIGGDSAAGRPWEHSPSEGSASGADYASGSASDSGPGESAFSADTADSADHGPAGAAGSAGYGAAAGSSDFGSAAGGDRYGSGSATGWGRGSEQDGYGSGPAGADSPGRDAPGDRYGTSGTAAAGYGSGSRAADPYGSGSAPGGSTSPYGAAGAGAAGTDSTSVFPAAGPGQDAPGQAGAQSAAGPAEAPYDPYGPYGPYGGRPAPSGPQQPYAAGPSGPQQPFTAEPSGPQASAAAGGFGPGEPRGDAGPGTPPPPSSHYAEGYGDEAPRKKSRKGLFIGIGAVLLVLALAGGVTGWYLFGRGPGPDETAAAFAAGWTEQDAEAMAAAAAGDPAAVLDPIVDNLGVEATAIELGEVTEGEDQTASAPFTATLSLKNAGDWTYESTMDLVREDGEWKVDFSPATVHPELSEGSTLVRGNVWGDRGRILAADGSPIDTQDTSESVQMLTGSVGTATAEDLERLGPAYAEGDPAGASGLQATYEERLAGKASISIRVAEEGAEEEVAADPEAPALETLEGEPGQDVTTTIDPALQGAASSAVSGASKPTALVAIRPSTGEIVASANNTPGFNRAFEGQYAPGSSFKIVTYEALLENGLTTDATMDCPKEAMGFTNAGDAKYGKQTVTEAFATSCNTALVQDVANRLDGSTLTAAAEMFGMNQEMKLGVPTHEPSFPTPDSTGMLAAQSIGQGQILTTPLHMATVPAAVADGSWRAPALVSDPEPKDLPEPTAIPQAETLRPMMRAVITDGTAEDAGFKGEVFGKTGSAEFGTAENEDDELDTHAWMVGYKGDVAFAVVVEGGGGGGSVAGPIGAKFTNSL